MIFLCYVLHKPLLLEALCKKRSHQFALRNVVPSTDPYAMREAHSTFAFLKDFKKTHHKENAFCLTYHLKTIGDQKISGNDTY